LSLCFFNRAPRNEGVLGEWRYSSTHYLTLALHGGEWTASLSGRFTHRERDPGIQWIGGWVGPRAVLDAVVKRKIPRPRRESKSRTPIVQPVAQRCWRKIQIQNSGGTSNNENIISNFKFQLPSLNQDTANVVFGKIIITIWSLQKHTHQFETQATTK
jgi:hypothetical protein